METSSLSLISLIFVIGFLSAYVSKYLLVDSYIIIWGKMGEVNKSKSDQLHSLLDKYCNNVGGVMGVGISSANGLEISSRFNGIVDPQMAHAVSSSLYVQSQNSANKLGLKGFNRNLTYTDKGIIALQKVNNDSVVLLMLKPDANVDQAMVQMKDFVRDIKRLI